MLWNTGTWLVEHTSQGTDGTEVGGDTLAEDESSGLVVGRGVGDSVGLTSLNATRGVLVDLESESSGDESSAGSDHLEETHFDVGGGLLIR
jgi:hypothetical protein